MPKFYVVGGWMRDHIMGLEAHDCDFVVVGATPEYFLVRNWKSVGKDFPVFLEPKNGFEVALARTEIKIGDSHTDFVSKCNGVTLEQDLSRRDLTINAIAQEVDWDETVKCGAPVLIGDVIDPFNGQGDIDKKILRECSEAFCEDALRVMRVARFLSKLDSFKCAWSLCDLCKKAALQLKFISKERIWMETEKALQNKNPRVFFEFLFMICILSGVDLFDEIFKLAKVDLKNDYHHEEDAFDHTMMALTYAHNKFHSSVIDFAVVMHDLGKVPCYEEYGNLHGHEGMGVPLVEEFCNKYKVPNTYKKLAMIVTEYHLKVHNCMGRNNHEWMKANHIMRLLEDTNALTDPNMFVDFLKACESDAKGRIGLHTDEHYDQRSYLETCACAAMLVDTKAISGRMLKEGKTGKIIGERIREARISAIRKVRDKWKK